MTMQKSAASAALDRPVESLSLPEQIVIWALRRYRAAGEGLAPLAAMFERIFDARSTGALAAFARLIRQLDQLPQAGEAAFLSQRLSPTEAVLLALMASLQQKARSKAAGIAARLVGPAASEALIAAAGDFAAALAVAGFPLGDAGPADASRPPWPPRTEAMLPTALVTADLVDAELLLLHAVRLWVVSIRLQRCSHERIARHFAEHGVPDAAASLHAILHHTSVAAARQVDVRCPPCRLLSPDEARLLHAIASAQRSDRSAAFETISDWLPLAAARLTLESVAGLAEALRRAGITLPPRSWDFDRLERLTAAATAAGPENCTVH
jgi:hypothetical protein